MNTSSRSGPARRAAVLAGIAALPRAFGRDQAASDFGARYELAADLMALAMK